MKEMTKKTAVVAMAGIMAAGMLTGCGEKRSQWFFYGNYTVR